MTEDELRDQLPEEFLRQFDHVVATRADSDENEALHSVGITWEQYDALERRANAQGSPSYLRVYHVLNYEEPIELEGHRLGRTVRIVKITQADWPHDGFKVSVTMARGTAAIGYLYREPTLPRAESEIKVNGFMARVINFDENACIYAVELS